MKEGELKTRDSSDELNFFEVVGLMLFITKYIWKVEFFEFPNVYGLVWEVVEGR